MSKKTWMPLYVADYLADTTRLTTEQHGAYMLLIMDYWRNGALPDDDIALSNITRLTIQAWKKHRSTLERMFQIRDGFWHHKRVERELQEAEEASNKYVERAKKAASKRWDKDIKNDASSNATSIPISNTKEMLEQCPSPSPSPSKKEDRLERIATSNTRADQKNDFQIIYDAGCEIFPNLATANTSSIHQWIQAGCHPELDVIPEIKRHKGRSIGAWKFFTGGIMDAKATRETQPPKGTPYASSGQSHASFDRPNKTERAKAAVMRAASAGGYAPERSDGQAGAGGDPLPVLPVA